VYFRSFEEENEDMRSYDGGTPRLVHHIAAGPHNVMLLLRQDVTPERMLEILYRRTGISGKWNVTIVDAGDVKTLRPRKVLLTPLQEPVIPKDLPLQLIETRVFFGTLERKSSCPLGTPPEQVLLHAMREAKMDDRWVVDRAIAETPKTLPTVIAKRIEPVERRQALPDGIESFVATHVEGGRQVRQHRIRCKGGESPDDQALLVSQAFGTPMKITEWVSESDGLIHLQCSRLEFVTIRYALKETVIDSWMQTKATTKQKEKLATALF
jgi:hypothetical protein